MKGTHRRRRWPWLDAVSQDRCSADPDSADAEAVLVDRTSMARPSTYVVQRLDVLAVLVGTLCNQHAITTFGGPSVKA